ncbi:hypothetical protein Prudu_004116, partial [Prunus dulcis]
ARIGAVTKKLWSKNREGQNGNLANKSDFIPPLSLLPVTFSLLPLSPSRDLGSCDPSPSKGRPGHHRPSRSPVGTYESTFVSPSQPDRSQPRGRPELAGKSCFPTEVPAKPPELPARNSSSFLHQIDRAPGARQNYKRDLRGIEVARTICHRNMRDPPPSHSNPPHHHVRGDSAEISAEV